VLKLSNRIRNWIRILIEKKIYGTGAYKWIPVIPFT
jgi:hypothetical protein